MAKKKQLDRVKAAFAKIKASTLAKKKQLARVKAAFGKLKTRVPKREKASGKARRKTTKILSIAKKKQLEGVKSVLRKTKVPTFAKNLQSAIEPARAVPFVPLALKTKKMEVSKASQVSSIAKRKQLEHIKSAFAKIKSSTLAKNKQLARIKTAFGKMKSLSTTAKSEKGKTPSIKQWKQTTNKKRGKKTLSMVKGGFSRPGKVRKASTRITVGGSTPATPKLPAAPRAVS